MENGELKDNSKLFQIPMLLFVFLILHSHFSIPKYGLLKKF